MPVKYILDYSKGFFTRSKYNSQTNKIDIINNPAFTSFIGDTDEWGINNGTIIINNDKITINNTTSANTYLDVTFNLKQDANTMCPIMFCVKAKGENITGTGSYNDFGIQIRVTFTDAGLSGGYEEVHQAFPIGTWNDKQFTLTYTPTQPIRYIYVYIFARNKTGKIIVWDGELFELRDTNISSYGIWESEIIDLYKINNKSVIENTLKLENIAFKYGDVDNVNNFYSIDYSKDYLSNFTYLVVEDHARLTTRELEITDYLKSQDVKIFGYTYIGWSDTITALTDSELKSHIDSMASQEWYGVFFDMAGNDYNVTRTRLNTYVDYAHSKGLKVFANAWDINDILSSTVDITYNPSGTSTSLTTDDWILLESFVCRGDDEYAGEQTGGWLTYINKYVEAVNLARSLGVKVGALAYQFSTRNASDTTDLNNSYNLALMCGVDAWSYGTTDYTDKNYPSLKYGNKLKGNIIQVNDNRWERETDRGTIWFEGNGSTVSSGVFSIIDYLDVEKIDVLSSKFSNAGRINVEWYTSVDKVNWIEWLDGSPKRYIKVKVEMVR